MYSAIIGIEDPDVKTALTPISFKVGMSFSGMTPPTEQQDVVGSLVFQALDHLAAQ